MKEATFRFYAELNDFLPLDQRQTGFLHSFRGQPSVKDTIEALGVPHTEVDLILVNGSSVGFSYLLQPGDEVSVYPVFESVDITPILRLRPEPLREPRFVLDSHLGKLAAYLRLVGFDTLYWSDVEDAALADVSRGERRILLTKDRDLLKRRAVTHGYFVRAVRPRAQLAEVVRRFDLARSMAPFRRCLRCNGILRQVPKEAVLDHLPTRTRRDFQEFQRCPDCGRVYWKGSHYRRMQRLIGAVLRDAAE